MKLERVDYARLNSRQKEIFNFQKVAGLLADYGYNCIKLSDDWHGADFLAYHYEGEETLKVQLKSRLSIDKKYCRKSLYMAFPMHGNWYLIEHDALVKAVAENTTWLESLSWNEHGSYSSANPNKRLLEAIDQAKL
uniref:PD(D/E)XK endonuclease domain-containing protein n=1 Tax=Candidatus Kentrum sp. FW TaxID=2126338 RepID=A0A450U443_9GAMM|nr:MAG: hypothetical protein BECKFW1821C_GA0114237_11602 [Candidatus Kentron sp. FW]